MIVKILKDKPEKSIAVSTIDEVAQNSSGHKSKNRSKDKTTRLGKNQKRKDKPRENHFEDSFD